MEELCNINVFDELAQNIDNSDNLKELEPKVNQEKLEESKDYHIEK